MFMRRCIYISIYIYIYIFISICTMYMDYWLVAIVPLLFRQSPSCVYRAPAKMDYTKPQNNIQSPNKQYKAPKDNTKRNRLHKAQDY